MYTRLVYLLRIAIVLLLNICAVCFVRLVLPLLT